MTMLMSFTVVFALLSSTAIAQLKASGPTPSSRYPGPELRHYLEMPKIVSSIKELRQLEDFPILSSTALSENPQFTYTDKRDETADSILKRLNRTAFRYSEQTALRFCVGCNTAKLWAESLIVIFDADYVTQKAKTLGCKNKESLYAFILAHELGHYLHELHISRHGKSPNDLGSCFAMPVATNTRDEKIESTKVEAWKHAEVDMYAMALTQALGYDLDCAEKLLAEYATSAAGTASFVDGSVRWRSMQYLRHIQKKK